MGSWLSLVTARAEVVCSCAACTAAGVTKPPVHLARTSLFPSRWLHGRDLAQFYRDEADAETARHDLARRIRRGHLQ